MAKKGILFHVTDDEHREYRRFIMDAGEAIDGLRIEKHVAPFFIECLQKERKNKFRNLRKYIGKA